MIHRLPGSWTDLPRWCWAPSAVTPHGVRALFYPASLRMSTPNLPETTRAFHDERRGQTLASLCQERQRFGSVTQRALW